MGLLELLRGIFLSRKRDTTPEKLRCICLFILYMEEIYKIIIRHNIFKNDRPKIPSCVTHYSRNI